MSKQDQDGQDARRVFISYAWTLDDSDFQPAVIELANELRSNGVDAIIDKFHLRPGHDANAFMEQSATGADKVLCLCNREYAEKANDRRGGAGAEAQILSPQVFTKLDQERVIPVLFGSDDGIAYRPTFLAHMVYVDLRLPQRRYDNFEELLRVIFDKPQHVPSELGRVPSFVAEETVTAAPTAPKVRQLEHAAQLGRPAVTLNLLTQDVAAAFGDEISKISERKILFEQAAIEHEVRSFLPVLGDYAKFVAVVVGDLSAVERRDALEQLLEFAVSGIHDNEARHVVAHCMFVRYVASLIKVNAWETLQELLTRAYLLDDPNGPTTYPFTAFNLRTKYLEDHRTRGPAATLLHECARSAGLGQTELLEAVLLLMFRSTVKVEEEVRGYWYPYELQESSARMPPPLFTRAESRAYLTRLLPVLGVPSIEELKSDDNRRSIQDWQGSLYGSGLRYISPLDLFHFNQLGARP